tara:strand:- start:72 stop:5480 length:5409 start_codon:yes stop_codon:yes gene_type:complete
MTTLSEQYQDMISLGLSEKELREFREEKSRELHALGFQPKQIAEEFGYKEPDSEFPTDYWKKVSTAYNSEKKAKPGTMASLQEQIKSGELSEAYSWDRTKQNFSDLKHAWFGEEIEILPYLEKGFGTSITKMAVEAARGGGAIPKEFLEERKDTGYAERAIESLANIIPDLPLYVGGGILGFAKTGNPIGAAFGAGFVPGAIREAYIKSLEDGEVDGFNEWFTHFLNHGLIAGGEEGITLAAALTAGRYTRQVTGSSTAAFGAEVSAFSLIGSAWEKRLPTKEEWINNTLVLGGLKLGARGIQKANDIVKKDSDRSPLDQIYEIMSNPEYRADIVSKNNKTPRSRPDLKEKLEGDNKPAIPPEVKGVKEYFSASTAKSDFNTGAKLNLPLGIDASILQKSKPAIQRAIDYLKKGGDVFVDSGAFSVFRFNERAIKKQNAAKEKGEPVPDIKQKEIDFDKTLDIYENIAENSKGRTGNLAVVAPDVLGNQKLTHSLLEKYAPRLRKLIDQGVDVLVPLQKEGLSPSENYRKVIEILERDDVRVSIPLNAKAWTVKEISELFEGNVKPSKFHLLGKSPETKKYKETVAAIKSHNKDADISSDSSTKLSQAVKIARDWDVKETEFTVKKGKEDVPVETAAKQETNINRQNYLKGHIELQNKKKAKKQKLLEKQETILNEFQQTKKAKKEVREEEAYAEEYIGMVLVDLRNFVQEQGPRMGLKERDIQSLLEDDVTMMHEMLGDTSNVAAANFKFRTDAFYEIAESIAKENKSKWKRKDDPDYVKAEQTADKTTAGIEERIAKKYGLKSFDASEVKQTIKDLKEDIKSIDKEVNKFQKELEDVTKMLQEGREEGLKKVYLDKEEVKTKETIEKEEAKIEEIIEKEEAAKEEIVEDKTALDRTKDSIVYQESEPAFFEKLFSKDTGNAFVEAWIDRLHPILRYVREHADPSYRNKKGKLAPGNQLNPYERLRAMYGAATGRIHAFIENGTVNFKTGELVGKAYKEILKPINNITKYTNLDAYAKAVRSVELIERKIETGLTKEDAVGAIEILDKVKLTYKDGKVTKETTYRKVLDELIEYQKSLLNYLVDTGVISRDMYDIMLEANKNYVPFKRVLDDAIKSQTSIGKTVVNPIKRIKGSERETFSPIESIYENTHMFISLAERNVALVEFIQMIEKSHAKMRKEGMEVPTDIKKSTPPTKRIKVTLEELKKEVGDIAELEGISQKKLKKLVQDEGFTVFRKDSQNPSVSEIAIFRNGKREVWEVGPELAKAFKEANAASLHWGWKLLGTPSRTLRAGATLAPDFFLRNMTRDTVMAGVLSRHGAIPFVTTAQGAWTLLRNKTLREKWIRSGGLQSMVTSMDRNYFDKQIKGHLIHSKPVNYLTHSPLRPLQILSEFFETSTRMGTFKLVYEKALKNGATEKQALERAGFEGRDVTIDFGKMGSRMKAVNAISAFFNARVQGHVKIFEGLRDRPTQTLTQIGGYIVAPSILLWLVNHDDKRYQELPEWQKTMFWIVITGEGENTNIYRIPKPFELGILFGTGTEKVLDWVYKNEKDAYKDLITDTLADVTFSMTFGATPDVIKPAVEGWMNKSLFSGRPIIPRRFEGIAASEQYTEHTSEFSKWLGSTIAYATDDYHKLASPLRIESIINNWTGTLGRYAVQALDHFLVKAGIAPEPTTPSKSLAEKPIIKAFMIKYPNANSQHVQDFYELYDKVSKPVNTYNAAIKRGDVATAKKFQDDYIKALPKYEALKGIEKALLVQRDLIDKIIRVPNDIISRDRKREMVEQLYRAIIDSSKVGLDAAKAMD